MTESNSDSKEIQDELKDSVHKVWLAGLGALSVAEEEGTKLFRNLVEKGESFESRGKENVSKVKSKVKDTVGKAAGQAREQATETWDRVEEKVDEAVTSAFQKVGVPSREEIATLTKRVEELTVLVEKMQTAAKKPPVKKKVTKRAPAAKTSTKTSTSKK